jgi:hypothetical protein
MLRETKKKRNLHNLFVELTKSRLLNEARLSYIESVNKKMLLKIEELESQIDKQNKRKAKEVNTSEVI